MFIFVLKSKKEKNQIENNFINKLSSKKKTLTKNKKKRHKEGTKCKTINLIFKEIMIEINKE